MGIIFVFSCSPRSETPLFVLEIMDSTNFGFRPLILFFAPSLFSTLDLHSFLGGGGSCRRQWKSAAPAGAAW
jgi:hypothetical protein